MRIDAALDAAGWLVQDMDNINVHAGPGVAVREYPLAQGHGFADYHLFVDAQAVGVLEAKAVGATLSGVEPQAQNYAERLPAKLKALVRQPPFLYVSTGVETQHWNLLNPHTGNRQLFEGLFHRPKTVAEWLEWKNEVGQNTHQIFRENS